MSNEQPTPSQPSHEPKMANINLATLTEKYARAKRDPDDYQRSITGGIGFRLATSPQLEELKLNGIDLQNITLEALTKAGYVFQNFIGNAEKPILMGTITVGEQEIDLSEKIYLKRDELNVIREQVASTFKPALARASEILGRPVAIEEVIEDMKKFLREHELYWTARDVVRNDPSWQKALTSFADAVHHFGKNPGLLGDVEEKLFAYLNINTHRGIKMGPFSRETNHWQGTNPFFDDDEVIMTMQDYYLDLPAKSEHQRNSVSVRINDFTVLMAEHGVENIGIQPDQRYISIAEYIDWIFVKGGNFLPQQQYLESLIDGSIHHARDFISFTKQRLQEKYHLISFDLANLERKGLRRLIRLEATNQQSQKIVEEYLLSLSDFFYNNKDLIVYGDLDIYNAVDRITARSLSTSDKQRMGLTENSKVTKTLLKLKETIFARIIAKILDTENQELALDVIFQNSILPANVLSEMGGIKNPDIVKLYALASVSTEVRSQL